MSKVIYRGKHHKDCPFTEEECAEFKAMLYYVNSTNLCANPPHPSWINAVAEHEHNMIVRQRKPSEIELLREENERLRNELLKK